MGYGGRTSGKTARSVQEGQSFAEGETAQGGRTGEVSSPEAESGRGARCWAGEGEVGASSDESRRELEGDRKACFCCLSD